MSKFDRESSNVNQVIFFSAPTSIPNMKALASYLKYVLRYLAHKIFKICFQRDIIPTRGITRT